MAKIKKVAKLPSNQVIKNKNNLRTWIRSFNIPRAARATRMAKKHLVVFLAVTFSATVLASAILPKNQFQLLKQQLVRNPDDFEAHLQLAEKFLENNQLEEAERALRLAQEIRNSQFAIRNSETKILGEQTNSELNELWQQKHYSDPQDIRRLIAAWEKIVAEKPNYRDGWLQLAVLYYKIYQNNQAKDALQKALEIDPNYQPARELEKIIL